MDALGVPELGFHGFNLHALAADRRASYAILDITPADPQVEGRRLE